MQLEFHLLFSSASKNYSGRSILSVLGTSPTASSAINRHRNYEIHNAISTSTTHHMAIYLNK